MQSYPNQSLTTYGNAVDQVKEQSNEKKYRTSGTMEVPVALSSNAFQYLSSMRSSPSDLIRIEHRLGPNGNQANDMQVLAQNINMNNRISQYLQMRRSAMFLNQGYDTSITGSVHPEVYALLQLHNLSTQNVTRNRIASTSLTPVGTMMNLQHGRFHVKTPISPNGAVTMPLTKIENPASMTSDIPLQLPACLASPIDKYKLSDHQYFLRYQIEAFQATEEDISTHTRGRNKPIVLGQVGIRCRHCSHVHVSRRQKGSTYFPANIGGLYQAAQNMSTSHIQCGLCTEMPEYIKEHFKFLIASKSASSGAGRPYWVKSAEKMGLIDSEEGIRFTKDINKRKGKRKLDESIEN